MQVRTTSNTVIHLTGPRTYTRTRGEATPVEHSCVVWGTVVPLGPTTGPSEGALIAIPVKGGLMPVHLLAEKVLPGHALCFLVLDDSGKVRFHVSTPVVEVDGKIWTHEGLAEELPCHLKRLLYGADEGEAAGGLKSDS